MTKASGQTTWAEYQSQPATWARLIERLGSGGLAFPVAKGEVDDLLLFGSGTSYYLALGAADWMRRRGWPARAVPSCEIMLDPEAHVPRADGSLAIGISRSGTSSEVLLAGDALRRAGIRVAAVSCTEGAAQLQAADDPILIHEGREDGLVMLRSISAMLLALQWLTGNAADRAALARLPDAGQALLETHGRAIADLAGKREFDRFVFLGSGPDYPLALEAALKVQEMAISTSEAYHSLEYRHGPKACADSRTLVCLFALPDRDHGLALARDMRALGAGLLVVGPDAGAYDGTADLVVPAPAGLSASQAGVLSLMPLQHLAYATALRLGRDPDAPQNLSKVVTF